MNSFQNCENDKVVAGVIGGIAEYFDMDASILRIVYILLAVVTAIVPAILGYIIAALIIPNKPDVVHMDHKEPEPKPEENKTN
ncbi:MAG: hypothetical protein UU06_C0004G0016 [Parcubacteria group bacterium GW2011_GWB1_40_5]|nr:MAG: hypothetical protein UU06_C0004G0016 [Parcubacteria group bacterium GW2011_GWB1_40_5]